MFTLFLRRNQSDQRFIILIKPSLFLSLKGWEGGGGGLKDGGDVGLIDVCVTVGCLVLADGFGYLLVIGGDGAGAFG